MLINIILIATILEIILFAFLVLIINKWISEIKELTIRVNRFQHKWVYHMKKARLKLSNYNDELEKKFTIRNSDMDFLFKMFFGLMFNILVPQVLPKGKIFRAISLISGDLWKNKSKLFVALAAFILRPKFAIRHR